MCVLRHFNRCKEFERWQHLRHRKKMTHNIALLSTRITVYSSVAEFDFVISVAFEIVQSTEFGVIIKNKKWLL